MRRKSSEQRRGPGRPKGPPEELRHIRMTVLLTDGEMAELQRLATERELPLGTVLHALVRRPLRASASRREKGKR